MGLSRPRSSKIVRSQRRATTSNPSMCSLKTIVMFVLMILISLYVIVMVALTRFIASAESAAPEDSFLGLGTSNHGGQSQHNEEVSLHNVASSPQLRQWNKRIDAAPRIQEWAHNVQPQKMHIANADGNYAASDSDARANEIGNARKLPPLNQGPPPLVLTAYMEEVRLQDWKQKPLPTRSRTTAKAELLQSRAYPQVNSCQRLPQQWPVDCDGEDRSAASPIIEDPFLPWIHDVFPTADGNFVQFVAQNRRRCHTGSSPEEKAILKDMQPQAALFQHVPVKRVDTDVPGETRYRLADHDEADVDGLETRFICHFKDAAGNTLGETLSFFNSNYEFAAFRKRQKAVFTEEGRDNKKIHTSQLIFQCPVPTNVKVQRPGDGSTVFLQDLIRLGESVDPQTDMALYYIDVVPIRTPPRYGPPGMFFPPYYAEFQLPPSNPQFFDAQREWGDEHILPKRADSGRWENVPICKPSALTYGSDEALTSAQEYVDRHHIKAVATADADNDEADDKPLIDFRTTRPHNVLIEEGGDNHQSSAKPQKQHRLISCLWASTGYTTRGNRFAINDGQRRLLEFLTYYDMIGVDHFYVYDNSGAFNNGVDGEHDINAIPSPSLKEITDLFPASKVTWINWPSKICNNNPNNVDSVGERSSQYAAESSCRLRFGPHTDWIGQYDLDEYLVPMGKYTNVNPQLLDKLESEGNTIMSSASWRAWPRRVFVADPNLTRLSGHQNCGRGAQQCFKLSIPLNSTILQAYNCDRQKPGQKQSKMPAEKQVFRADYVKQHYLHYPTITAFSELNREDSVRYGPEKFRRWRPHGVFPDPLARFGDEQTEALMLHAKAVATQDTGGWEKVCKAGYDGQALCRLGNPYPEGDAAIGVDTDKGDESGLSYNCYINHKIDDYYIPKLEQRLQKFVPEIRKKLEKQNMPRM